jgi:hypothetical protein
MTLPYLNMTIEEYQAIIKINNFEEYPFFIIGKEQELSSFINYDDTNIDLKIYLCKQIICRSFPPTNGIYNPENPKWFIRNFILNYKTDYLKPWITDAIKAAVELILCEEVFTKGILGTSFMFGIIEFYAKYELGFRPNKYDFFDKNKKDYFKIYLNEKEQNINDISIGKALKLLQATNTVIANSLNEIDNFNSDRLKKDWIKEKRWVKAKISDRISLIRNTMLHGETHGFYDIGMYLILLYILFHLHRTKLLNT